MKKSTQKDKAIVSFLARVGFAQADQIATRFSMTRRNANMRLRALLDASVVDVSCRHVEGGWVYGASPPGMRMVDTDHLHPARFALSSIHHTLAVASVIATTEASGFTCLSEREIGAHRRAGVDSRYEFAYREHGRNIRHLPDMTIELTNGRFVAIEIERFDKSTKRVESILNAYRRRLDRDGFIGVIYLTENRCSPNRLHGLAKRRGLSSAFSVAPVSGQMPIGELRALHESAVARATKRSSDDQRRAA